MLQVAFRFFGQCAGVRSKPRPDPAPSPRIALDTSSPRTGAWSRLLRTLFFWRGRRTEPARTSPPPRVAYTGTPPSGDAATTQSIYHHLAPPPPDALVVFCAGYRKDSLQKMMEAMQRPEVRPAPSDAVSIAAWHMVNKQIDQALRTFEPDGIVPPAVVEHVVTRLDSELAKVCDGKGVLGLVRLRDDWVSRRPRDRDFLAGGVHAAGTFDMFRRSVEALCRLELADGEPALTKALANQLREAAQALRKASVTGGLTVADMTGHANALRSRERDTALDLIRRQLGTAHEAAPPRLSNAARPDQAAEAASSLVNDRIDDCGIGEPRSSPPQAAVKTLTDLLLDPGSDADQAGAAMDLLVHNLRTLARQREGEAVLTEIERRVDDLLARAGAQLTERQLHHLGDALQRLDLKACHTCHDLLNIREALREAGKQALRDAMAGVAGVRARQSPVRAHAQALWLSLGRAPAAVHGKPNPPAGVGTMASGSTSTREV